MLAALTALLLFVLVVEPLLVLCHELGHAVAPLARGQETVVFVGGEAGYTARIGSLTLLLSPRGFLAPVTYGATATEARAGRGTVLAGALGGPVVSMILLVALWQFVLGSTSELLGWLTVLTVGYLWFQTAFTLLPLRYPGWAGQYGDYRSDGMIALDMLRGRDGVND